MGFPDISQRLSEEQQRIVAAVKAHAERLLDHSPRFKYFTLHGRAHIENLFSILELLINGGIKLTQEELFILSLAICVHDLGMVVTLQDLEPKDVLQGPDTFPDAAALESYIREVHHNFIDQYFQQHLDFMAGLGVRPIQIAQIKDVSRCHRKVVLEQQKGMTKYLGALLRVLDELDLGGSRAPTDVFLNIFDQMDPTSCWHWFKHNIVEGWSLGHTVFFTTENDRKRILFRLAVRPTRDGSIDYWLAQSKRPIFKALKDDRAEGIIQDKFQVQIELETDRGLSRINKLGQLWEQIEERALSAGRKVVLVIDDEFRKMEDLFYPVMDYYHVVPSPNAKDAFTKLAAMHVDLAIVDIQIGSGFIWKEQETQEFKLTGVKICEEIRAKYPATKVGVLTGTRHAMPDLTHLALDFEARKPIDPAELLKVVQNVLS